MFNDLTSPAAFLSTRRSGKPRDLVAPGPDAATLDRMLAIAARTPDHGKLAPWRFVVIEDRDRFAALLRDALTAERPGASAADLAALDQFARQAPVLVAVLSTPNTASPVPVWEQELSAGAACMNLLHAAGALGFAGGWLTGWAAFSTQVRDTLLAAAGVEVGRIAGYVFIGTPGRPLEERPRPDMDKIVCRW